MSQNTVRPVKIGVGSGGFTGALDAGDRFGASVLNLGDVDGDGVEDLAVGAPGDDDGGAEQGAVWILFLRTDGTVRDYQKISSEFGNFDGLAEGEPWFGIALAKTGDLNGDGVPDLAVKSAPTSYILLLDAAGGVISYDRVSSLGDDPRFNGMCGTGDFNNDGVNDLAETGSSYLGLPGGVGVRYLDSNGRSINGVPLQGTHPYRSLGCPGDLDTQRS